MTAAVDPAPVTVFAATAPRARDSRRDGLLPALLIALGLLGMATGVGFAAAGSHAFLFAALTVGAVLGIGLTVLAALRFEALLLVLFAVRPLLDSLKQGYTTALAPSSAVGLVFLLAGVVWLVARARVGRFARPSGLSVAIIGLVVAGVLSVVGSASYGVSAQAALKLASGLVMFLVLEQIVLADPRGLRPLLVAVIAITIGSSVIAIVEGVLRTQGDGRVRGVFVHENDLAEFTVTVALLLLALRPHLLGRLRTYATWAVVLSMPALYLTYTRGAWVGFVLGLLVIGAIQDRRLIAVVLVGLVVTVALVPGVTSRFSDLKDKRVTGRGDPNSFAFRERYWGEIAPLANSTPITGIGLDMVEHSTPEMLLPHNTPLEVWLETGAAGSVTFVALVGGMALGLRRAVKGLPRGPARGWAVGGAAAAAAFGLEMLTDNLLLQALQLWYLAFAVMPGIALLRASRRQPGDERGDPLAGAGRGLT